MSADELDTGASVVIRHTGGSLSTTRLRDLELGVPLLIGSGPDNDVVLDQGGPEPGHISLEWDGEQISLRDHCGHGLFVGGKPCSGSVTLEPGEEFTFSDYQFIVGVKTPYSGGRRALTHQEFLERLHEELARAARSGRPTALVMLRTRSGEGARVSAAALAAFRAGDLVATYAPDEPEFLLPDVDAATAEAVVRRVLDGIGADASMGAAVSPDDAEGAERLLYAARRALDAATNASKPGPSNFGGEPFVPQEPRVRDIVVDLPAELSQHDRSVLITGEASTGKSHFASGVYDARATDRRGPLAVISCAALTDEASVERAFGAPGAPGGQALEARGGTLILDELGDLSREAQQRLLALLEVAGGGLRLLSTTQRALPGLVERGAFSSALYARVSDQTVELPPLRSRGSDILAMARHFAAQAASEQREREFFSAAAIIRLYTYPWPGNIIELKNAMERAMRLAAGGEILAEHLPSRPAPISLSKGRLREHVDSVERDAIIKALADSHHNQTRAAKALGISRRALIYKMEKYGLKPPPGTARGRN